MTVIVKKIGGSVAVVIPKAVAREMELTEGTSLDVRADAEGLVMRKRGRRPRRAIGKIASRINSSSYRRRAKEMSGDGPVGKERW